MYLAKDRRVIKVVAYLLIIYADFGHHPDSSVRSLQRRIAAFIPSNAINARRFEIRIILSQRQCYRVHHTTPRLRHTVPVETDTSPVSTDQ